MFISFELNLIRLEQGGPRVTDHAWTTCDGIAEPNTTRSLTNSNGGDLVFFGGMTLAARTFALAGSRAAPAGPKRAIVWLMIVYPLATLVGAALLLFVVNLLPGPPTLWNVVPTASMQNYPLSQIGLGPVDAFTECIAVTMGLGEKADRMTPLKRTLASPTLGNCEQLRAYELGERDLQFDYWRYWHGYQILSRPILFIGDVRLLHFVSFSLLAAAFGWFLHAISKFGLSRAVAVAAAVACVPVSEQFGNLPQSVVLILGFSAAAFVVTRATPTRTEWKAEFIVLGVLCSFFDLSTIPVVSLTLPLLALYWKGEADPASRRLTASDVVILSILWAVGWLLCWMCKWWLAALGGEPAVMATLKDAITHRLGVGGAALGDDGSPLVVTSRASLTENLGVCLGGLLLVFGLANVRFRAIAAAILSRKRRPIADYLPPLMIFLLPIAWLSVVKQHSIWHAGFVARVYLTDFAMVIAWLLGLPKPTPAVSRRRKTVGQLQAGHWRDTRTPPG